MKKFDLGCGHLGNGLTVWNRAREVHGDYQKIAHISVYREVTWYIKNPPPHVVEYVLEASMSDMGVSETQPEQKVFHN